VSKALGVNKIQMLINYRNQARSHLKNSNILLESNADKELTFAALELRMAMEAITYDRAIAYKDEFPPSEYATWQPRKVLLMLLEIDPNTDKDSAISFGLEEKSGVPASKMTHLGRETVLNLSTLKRHYDALGNYLHIPSLKQSNSGKTHNFVKLRQRCDEIAQYISEVLTSKVFNCTLGNFTSIECEECGKTIRKRITPETTKFEVECYSCQASYTVTEEADNKYMWSPQQQKIECVSSDCNDTAILWRKEIEVGKYWICKKCNGKNTFALGVTYESPNN
jgi:hypothetical protein